MLETTGRDLQKAFQVYGQRVLELFEKAYGVQLPTRQVTVPPRTEVTATPRTAPPPGFVRMREPKEGEPLYGYEVATKEIPGETRVELALPEPEQLPEDVLNIPIPFGGREIPLGRLLPIARALPESILRAIISETSQILRMKLDALEQEWRQRFDEAKFNWQRYTDEQKLKLQELDQKFRQEIDRARLELDRGNQQLAWERFRQAQQYQQEMLNIQRARLGLEERRTEIQERREERLGTQAPRDPVLADLEKRLANTRVKIETIGRMLETPAHSYEFERRTRTREQLMNLHKQLVAEEQSLQRQVMARRAQLTTYRTKTAGVLTSAQIQQLIRQAINQMRAARTKTGQPLYSEQQIRAHVRQMLINEGIPPERFGF